MARKSKYTQPLQVVTRPDQRARIEAIAERDEVSMAEVVRDIIDLGIDEREARTP